MRNDRRILLYVLGVSLVLRLVLWGYTATASPSTFITHDSKKYHENALSLLRHGTLAQSPDTPDQPETLRTPGYPFFLAAVYVFFGENPSIAILAQIFIGIANLSLIYSIAHKLWSTRVAILAVILYALDPGPLAFSLLLMTETLFTMLILCMLAVVIRLLRREKPLKWALAASFFLALATLVRPVGYYLFFPLLIALIVYGISHRKDFKPVGVVVCFIVPFVLITGAWQLRNYLLTGHAELSMLSGQLMMSKAAEVVAMKDHTKIKAARLKISGSASGRTWEQGGFAYLKQYPFYFLRRVAERSYRVFVPSGFSIYRFFNIGFKTWPVRDLGRLRFEDYFQKWGRSHPLVWVSYILMGVYLILIYAAAAFAVWHSRKNRPLAPVHLFFGLVFIYFLAVSLAIGFNPRFFLPAMPIVFLYAASGLELLWSRRVANNRSLSHASVNPHSVNYLR